MVFRYWHNNLLPQLIFFFCNKEFHLRDTCATVVLLLRDTCWQIHYLEQTFMYNLKNSFIWGLRMFSQRRTIQNFVQFQLQKQKNKSHDKTILYDFNTDKTMVLEGIVDYCRMNFLKRFLSLKLQLQTIFNNLWKKTFSNGAKKLLMSSKVYKKYYRNIKLFWQ